MKIARYFVVFPILFALLNALPASAAAEQTPNILLILTDD